MYDINYFTLIKRQKEKNKMARVVITSMVVLIVVLNVVILSIGFVVFNKLENHIKNNQAYLDSPVTKAKVRDVAIMNKELTIAKEYLSTLMDASSRIKTASQINVNLIDHIRSLTPASTRFVTANYNELTITLSCFSTEPTDPMNFYNKLLGDERFSNVIMPGFTISESNIVTYSVELTLKGGE